MKRTPDYIAVIDFGSQFAHLIARRVRQLNVLAKIFTPDTPASVYQDAAGVILSGGPKSTIGTDAIAYDPGMFKLGKPMLGLCYGHQLIAKHFGGTVAKGKTKEYGQAQLTVKDKLDLFKGLNTTEPVWMSHWDNVMQAPRGFTVLGTTPDSPVAAMVNRNQQVWSCLFHLEVHHTTHGMKILQNFVLNIVRAQSQWKMRNIEHDIINDIKRDAKNKKVFMLLSGGVDSTVAFALLEKALGKKRVYGLHVDNGFMRLKESVQVKTALNKAGFTNLHMIDASARFLRAVQGIVEPEAKRQRIGELFVEIANEEMTKLDMSDYLLGQGTIYPDTIESGGTKHSDKIKTHHNQIDLIKQMILEGKVIEPLRNLYKDEVRVIGKRLGLVPSVLNRQPFPGPGLAIRTLCSNGNSMIENAQNINAQLEQLIKKSKIKNLQAKILPMKSVGAQGDERSYKHPVVITGQANWKQLNDLSVRITNEVFAVNRVLWFVRKGSHHSLSNGQMHARYLVQDRLDLLRVVDDQVMQIMKQHKFTKDIWQFPVVLVPFGTKQNHGESIVLRPIQSEEVMTVNFYAMPKVALNQVARVIYQLPHIDYLFYDITHKPPATVEWE